MEKETDEKSCGCQGKCCKVRTFLEEKNTFTNKDGSDTHKIREGLHLDCSSKSLKMQKTVCRKLYYEVSLMFQ